MYRFFNKRSFFLLITILSICSPAQGQVQGLDPDLAITQYNYTSWNTDHGLPANGINSLAQSKKGYLWLATYNGLVRFDGFTFEIFNQKNLKNLKTSSFINVYQDPNEDIIWVTSDGNGLISFKDIHNAKFYDIEHGLPSNVTTSVLRDSKGRLWVGTTSGVAYLEDGQFKTLDNDKNLKNTTVNAIEEGADGTIYLGTSSMGLFKINSSDSISRFSLNLSSYDITSLTFDETGYLWIGTYNGVDILDVNTNHLIKNEITKTLENTLVSEVFVDNRQTIWIGSSKGLYRLAKNKLESFKSVKPQEITNIEQDYEGNLWMSTYRSGLFKLTQGKLLTTSKEEGLSADVIYGVEETKDKKILIATKQGLNIKEGNSISTLKIGGQLLSSTVRMVIEAKNQNYYIGTDNGLYIVEPNGGYSILNKENGLNDNYIRQLWEDHNGDIWIGTSIGINILDKKGNISSISRQDGLVNDFVLSIFEDSNGRVWVGTKNGFSVFKNKKIVPIELYGEKLEGPVFMATEDNEGTVWLGISHGIMRYKNDTLKAISYKDGLPFNVSFQVLADNKNRLWFTTNEGIFEMQKGMVESLFNGKTTSDIKFRKYGKGDGMKIENCTANARSILRSNGEFLIPTFKGVVSFHPDSLSPNTISPKVYIESVKVDGEDAKIKGNKYIIPANGKRVVINYTGLSFMAPDEIVFKYTLSGVDEKLNDAGHRREASYMNLEPGTYEFRVLASNGDGVWDNLGKNITLQKLPHFSETIVFRVLVLASFATLFFSYVFFRIRGVKKAQVELERKVLKKTQELQIQNKKILVQRESIRNQNSQLESKNKELTELNEEKNHLIGVVAHDLKSPLSQIKGLVNILKMEMNTKSGEENKYIEMIENSIDRQNKMISKILDVNSIETQKVNFQYKRVNVFDSVKETLESFYETARNKNINILLDQPDSLFYINVDQGIYMQIIENLVSNSIKFSPLYMKIAVKVEKNSDGEIVFSVKDQGPGINEEDKKKIFGKYQKLSAQPTGGESSTGLGLSIVKMYVENMGGRVWFESEVGEGAAFYVAFKEDR